MVNLIDRLFGSSVSAISIPYSYSSYHIRKMPKSRPLSLQGTAPRRIRLKMEQLSSESVCQGDSNGKAGSVEEKSQLLEGEDQETVDEPEVSSRRGSGLRKKGKQIQILIKPCFGQSSSSIYIVSISLLIVLFVICVGVSNTPCFCLVCSG